MRYRVRIQQGIIQIFVLVCLTMWPGQAAIAQSETPPPLKPITAELGPWVVDDNHRIYNDSIVPDLPAQSRKADIGDDGRVQEEAGRGIRHTQTGEGHGLNLYAPIKTVACNDFNQLSLWASQAKGVDPWHDSYAGWGAFAVDDGNFHKAQNVVIAMERTVGPGSKYGADQFSAKITSNQPYAAGFGSPLIAAPPGATVTVSVDYLIFDHDTHSDDYDWVSLGIKSNATLPSVEYVNGLSRGVWQTLSHTISAGETGQIMVLIQAESPAALNSNVYFDDVQIMVDGEYVRDCTY